MTAEPAPTSISRPTQLFVWLTWLALAAVLIFGAWLRWQWPPEPISDPDTWGYLNPALSKLLGQGFKHTYGRNFVYPGWVYLWLRCSGDFRAISVDQHILGLATGLVLWRVWEQWRAWFVQPRLPGWISTSLGLGLAAFYVSSTTVIHFEHQIRPEAIFPFFAVMAICLTMEFLRAWFVTRQPGRAAGWAGAVVFAAILLYQLKPSFGLTVGVALLPLFAAALPGGRPWRQRLGLAAGAAVGVVLAGFLLLWPEHVLGARDEHSTLFLPETLLTVHADVIRDQMALDLAAGNPTPYTAEWLTRLHDELAHEITLASAPEQRPYGTLGFNPDYLLYQDSYCRFLYREMGPTRVARLGFYYFERAWLRQPGAMARNVGRQLSVFYTGNCPAFWLGRAVQLDKNYLKTINTFTPANYQVKMQAYPPARAYLAESARLAQAPAVYRQPLLFTVANTLAAEGHLPLLMAAVAGLALVLGLRSAPVRQELGPPGWLVLLFFAYTFGNCLTVAIVHSLDIDRYSSNLVIFAILAEAAALAWCVEALLCARFRLNPELSAPDSRPPADASPR